MLAVPRFSFCLVVLSLSFLSRCQAQETSYQGNITSFVVKDPNIVFTVFMPALNCSDDSEFQKISDVIQFMNAAVQCRDCSLNNSILCPEQFMSILVSQSGLVQATRYQLLINTMVNAINCLSARIEETVVLIEYVPKPEGFFIPPSKEMPVFEECQVYEETSNITDIEEILLLGMEDEALSSKEISPEPELEIQFEDEQLEEPIIFTSGTLSIPQKLRIQTDDQQLEERHSSLKSLLDTLGLEESELLLPLEEQRQLEKLLMQNATQILDTPMSEMENASIEQLQNILTQQNSLSNIDITQLQIAVSLSFYGQQPPPSETLLEAEIESVFSKNFTEFQEALKKEKEEEEILADNSGLVHPMPDLVRLYKKILGQQ